VSEHLAATPRPRTPMKMPVLISIRPISEPVQNLNLKSTFVLLYTQETFLFRCIYSGYRSFGPSRPQHSACAVAEREPFHGGARKPRWPDQNARSGPREAAGERRLHPRIYGDHRSGASR